MKIHNKIFIILFSFSFVLVTALVLLIQWSIGKGMIEYVNSKDVETLKPLIVELKTKYKKSNSWSSMQGQHKIFGDLVFEYLSDSTFIPPPPKRFIDHSVVRNELESKALHLDFDRPPPPEFGHLSADAKGARSSPMAHMSYALLDNKQNIIAGHYLENMEYSKKAIVVDRINVGWLVIPKRNKITDGYELDFIEQQHNYLWIIALAVMVLVALVTLLLARHLAEPIKCITSGMHKLTQGNYQQQIDVKRKDELGELSRDFNELAITLHENESARKRWLANISHELRTPVAILRGELEAMLDGVRVLSKTNIDSANDEVKHLANLIDDLHQLTSADIGGMHYRKKTDDLGQWLNSEMNKYTGYLAAAGISLDVDIAELQANVFADKMRLCQLFENVINNCIKYAQASSVKISLEVDENTRDGVVRVKIEDDGVGVSDQHLPHLFEHLYRVENSRNRKMGGSGLGLSICAHIVAAHQGTIVADLSDLGGLAIIIELPLSK